MLQKQKSSLFGLGSPGWHDCFVLLDPSEGVLKYWEAKNSMEGLCTWKKVVFLGQAGKPKCEIPLEHIMWVECNNHHWNIMIVLCNPSKPTYVDRTLHFTAGNALVFQQWMDALSCYGMTTSRTSVASPVSRTRYQLI
jgi:hypothetical protein